MFAEVVEALTERVLKVFKNDYVLIRAEELRNIRVLLSVRRFSARCRVVLYTCTPRRGFLIRTDLDTVNVAPNIPCEI